MELEWEYSRNWRTHWIDDGEYYGKTSAPYWQLWAIASAAPYGFAQGKHGYDLYHKSKKIMHGKTVKELKLYVAEQEGN